MRAFLAGLLLMAFGMNATAALEARDLNGDGTVDAYYDSSLGITWLQDANYLATLFPGDSNPWAGPGSTGGAGDSWAAQVDIYGTTGWRLPNAMASLYCAQLMSQYGGAGQCGDSGDPAVSEMAHLGLITLGNGPGNVFNTGPFINYQPGVGFAAGYWTNVLPTPGAPGYPVPGFYYIHSDLLGDQFEGQEEFAAFVWFVHDGDIGSAVPSVPEIPTYLLMLTGLAVLGYRKLTIR